MGGLQSMAMELGISVSQAASGAAALAPAILDMNGDGNPLDDSMHRAGKVMR
jgi:hypothetical protein